MSIDDPEAAIVSEADIDCLQHTYQGGEEPRRGVCDVHDLVDDDQTERPTRFCVKCKAWICDECHYNRNKRAQALLIRFLSGAQARPPNELLEAIRTRQISPDVEVLLWEAAFGPPVDD